MTERELLQHLASLGHSRSSAHVAAGISWHTFRSMCAAHPDIEWRSKGDNRRKCYPRRKFRTLDSARAAAAAIAARGGVARVAECCPLCNGWHLA